MKTQLFIPFVRLAILLFLILPMSLSGFSQINVVPFSSSGAIAEKDGIIYSLPRNIIKVKLEIVKTENFRGPYAAFSTKLLGLTGIVEENSISYEIGNVELSTFAEADPDQIYFVELDAKSKDAGSLIITLSDEGYISGFTDITSVEREVRNAIITGDFNSENLKPFRDLLKPVLIEKVDTIVRRISIDTTTVEEKVLKRSISEKLPEQQAREVADLIYRIQDSKFSLVTGYQEVNYSRESLEFMLEQLNKLENEYLALFKGTSKISRQVYIYYVTPQSTREGTLETICRFSKTKGLSDKSTSVGESVSLVITPLNRNTKLEEFAKQRDQVAKKMRGFYYRIPEKSLVTLRAGGIAVAENQMLISQMGVVTYLPAAHIKDVGFHPENGAIIRAIAE
ncbi:MAG: DUF4831 family protein [Lentimicrobium sp.]